MSFSFAQVTAATDVGPRLRRVRFEVPDLRRLELPDLPDEVVGIYFPAPGRSAPPAMTQVDGVWAFHEVEPAPEGRTLTVREVDHVAGTMAVDFVVHGHGPATEWAQAAQPGDQVTMAYARGWYRPDPDADWHLLVADLSGLPALARILGSHPRPESVTAVVEVADDDDLEYVGFPRQTRVIPLVGSGNGLSPSALGDAVAGLDVPAGRGYCWFAGEAAQSRAVRKHLRNVRRWHRDQYDVIGYWRDEGERWARRYAAHGDDLLAVYQRALAAGKGEKAAAEEFDEALERAGL
jgi:NADPH-dependent ferric siderophore reductase